MALFKVNKLPKFLVSLFFASLIVVGITESKFPNALTNQQDGSLLVFVPGDSQGADGSEHGFYIGKYPVTNAQFRLFVESTGYQPKGNWKHSAEISGDNLPVVDVSWQDANTYCKWAGLRLPKESEWDVASSGALPLEAPEHDGVYPIDREPRNVSIYGCSHLFGNIEQWCSNSFIRKDGKEVFAIRGSSWRGPEESEILWKGAPSSLSNNALGFRVAKSIGK